MFVAFSKSSILPGPLQGPVAIGLQILGQVQALTAASALESERVAQMPPAHFFKQLSFWGSQDSSLFVTLGSWEIELLFTYRDFRQVCMKQHFENCQVTD